MVKCGKIISLGDKPSINGYITFLDLEDIGKVVVPNKLYKLANIGDVVSLDINDMGEFEVINIFSHIKGTEEFESLKTKYKSINLCEK